MQTLDFCDGILERIETSGNDGYREAIDKYRQELDMDIDSIGVDQVLEESAVQVPDTIQEQAVQDTTLVEQQPTVQKESIEYIGPLRQRKVVDHEERSELLRGGVLVPKSRRNTEMNQEQNSLLLKHHKTQQENMSDELVRLASVLKQNSMSMGDKLKKDAVVMGDTVSAMDSSLSRVRKQGQRVSQLIQTSWKTGCMVYLILILVMLLFTLTFVFMRVFKA
jgi:hypothetical protein